MRTCPVDTPVCRPVDLKGTFSGLIEMFYILVLDSDHIGIYNYQKSLNQ